MGSKSDSRWSDQGSFPRRGVYKFAFQLFEWFQWTNNRWGSRNERFYDKMWGKTVRGMEVCEIPVRLPMNDTVMETVECMWVDIWCMLD